MDIYKLNLRHLRAFLETARAGSISAAASEVHLSQPAITQALAKLEKTLGAALFFRNRGGIFLTEPGEGFRDRVARVQDHLRQGAERCGRAGGRKRSGGFQHFDHLLTSAQLRALLAVEDSGNFSWAARQVGIAQPALYRTARDLERISGVPLYEKTAQGIELTPAAQALALSTRLAYAELKQGIDEINAWLGHDSAEVVIGTMPLARSYVLPKAINDLTRLRPEIRVRVIDGPYADLLHGLRHGQFDLLIGALRDPVPADDVEQAPLFDDALAILARSGHPLSEQETVTIRDLATYAWVTPPEGVPTRVLFESLFSEAGIAAPSRIVETSSQIVLRGLLMGSDRLTILSPHQVRLEMEQGLLSQLNVELKAASRTIGLSTRKDWQPTATQSLLLDLLATAARKRFD
ncbi:LysR family transcriptional regulator [Aliiruegeria lutimaris]|uniref:DNA-binding transcriptional regulator, LysR family n=1 Tax=Aliiruegeria lutimaris TaxID=571298 RepID=A0A1G8UMD9_9RHOB|nr:LysR family transcriptional regulator [Aliiruegeria lutimaris]SDJ54325.1 DNA-binding transcriptional regulator, LysR family [Aliiruegeria lutimaris]